MLLCELLVRGDSTQLANPSNCPQHSHKTKQESKKNHFENIFCIICVHISMHLCAFEQNATQDLTIIWKHYFENLFIVSSFWWKHKHLISVLSLKWQVANPSIGHINLYKAKLKLETILFENKSYKTPQGTKQNQEKIIYVHSCVSLLKTQTSYQHLITQVVSPSIGTST